MRRRPRHAGDFDVKKSVNPPACGVKQNLKYKTGEKQAPAPKLRPAKPAMTAPAPARTGRAHRFGFSTFPGARFSIPLKGSPNLCARNADFIQKLRPVFQIIRPPSASPAKRLAPGSLPAPKIRPLRTKRGSARLVNAAFPRLRKRKKSAGKTRAPQRISRLQQSSFGESKNDSDHEPVSFSILGISSSSKQARAQFEK